MQTEQSIYTDLKEGIWNGMGTSLEWMTVVGRRRFTSGQRTVEGEEKDSYNHRRSAVTDFMRSKTWNKLWQKISMIGVWEWIDGSQLFRV